MADNELWLDVSAYETEKAPVQQKKSKLPVKKVWLQKSIESLDVSIKEAIGRYDTESPTYSPLARPVASKNWQPKSSKSKAGPEDIVKAWATCGTRIRISLSPDSEQTIIKVRGKELVGLLRKMKAIFENPNFEQTAVGKRFAEVAKENSKPKKFKQGYAPDWNPNSERWDIVISKHN